MVCAKLQNYNGAPAIFINGKYTEPTALFGRINAEYYGEKRKAAYHSELARAARSGVHIHTMFLFMDHDLTGPDEESNAENRRMLHELLKIDPEAYLIPRVLTVYDPALLNIPESEKERFTDGKGYAGENFTRADFISPVWREKALTCLRRFIRSILCDPVLSERVIGYHFSGGETGEWFQRRYWDGVLNISDANTLQFRKWLRKKYSTDEALSCAWGEDVTLNKASVPADLPGLTYELESTALLDGDEKRKYIDYLDYYSDEIVDLIEEGARLVKKETGGNSLFVTFYGYHFEIPGAYSGHNSFAKLLRCPDVDIISSPVSYKNRNEGGIGAYMACVGSVIRAGKMWFDESDYRMPVVRVPNGDIIPSVSNIEAAGEVILREYGKLALHGAGTWWMDLFNIGWFDDDAMWEHIARGRECYEKMRKAFKPTTAEICYIIDEKAMSLSGDTWNFAYDILTKTRNEAYTAGLSFDMRLIDDFLEGGCDGAKVYVFVNPFRLEERGMERIVEKIRENGACALWCFGFTPSADKVKLKALTGFDFEITEETEEEFDLQGTKIKRVPIAPLTVPMNGEALAAYPDGKTAFAKTHDAGYKSYFCSGTYVAPEVLRTVAKDACAGLYTDIGDCFNRIGNLALLHTATAGEKTLEFGAPVTELRSNKTYENGKCILNAKAAETFLFSFIS